MAVTIFEDLVLRERRDALLEVAVPQRQQRALVVEECHARGQCRHLRLLGSTDSMSNSRCFSLGLRKSSSKFDAPGAT